MADRIRKAALKEKAYSTLASVPHPAATGPARLRLAYCLEWLGEAAFILSPPSKQHEHYAFYLAELPLMVADAQECLTALTASSPPITKPNDTD